MLKIPRKRKTKHNSGNGIVANIELSDFYTSLTLLNIVTPSFFPKWFFLATSSFIYFTSPLPYSLTLPMPLKSDGKT